MKYRYISKCCTSYFSPGDGAAGRGARGVGVSAPARVGEARGGGGHGGSSLAARSPPTKAPARVLVPSCRLRAAGGLALALVPCMGRGVLPHPGPAPHRAGSTPASLSTAVVMIIFMRMPITILLLSCMMKVIAPGGARHPRPSMRGTSRETAVCTGGGGGGGDVASVVGVGRGEKHKLWQNSHSELPLSRNSRAVTQ